MLRIIVLLLVLTNGAFFLWSQGHLRSWGLAPDEQREPERLKEQIAPQTVRLLNTPRDRGDPDAPASEAEPAAARDAPEAALPAPAPQKTTTTPVAVAAPAPPAPQQAVIKPSPPATPAPPASPVTVTGARACWQASGFTEAQADGLRASLVLLDLPGASWQLREVRSPARWLVYLGRYENTAQLERKRAELRSLNVVARTVTIPGLAPGLFLSSHTSEAAAREAQQAAVREGIRSARVAQAFAESISYTLRLPSISAEQRVAVQSSPALAGKPLLACN